MAFGNTVGISPSWGSQNSRRRRCFTNTDARSKRARFHSSLTSVAGGKPGGAPAGREDAAARASVQKLPTLPALLTPGNVAVSNPEGP